MRKTILALTCLLAGVLIAPFAAANVGAVESVPLKGMDTFSSVVIGGSGSVIYTADSGSGTATHLGLFTMAASEVVDFASMTVRNGTFTLTAANGDTVSGTYSGTILPGLVGYHVSGPITGGTGRFAGATGAIIFDGIVDPATLTGSDVISGTITSVGSI
jgi:hypothetical protein